MSHISFALRLLLYTETMPNPPSGENDENIYIVQKGRVSVYVSEQDGSTFTLKEVLPGESIISLLSFCDILTGHPQPYKTVGARAEEKSIVMKFPVGAFRDVFKKYPEMFVRVVQIIMVRLMRVTFTALHQYLGLSAELIDKVMLGGCWGRSVRHVLFFLFTSRGAAQGHKRI